MGALRELDADRARRADTPDWEGWQNMTERVELSNPNARQVGGGHYKGHKIEHWDLMAALYGAAYFEAAITKYVERWAGKDGVKDVEKATHYFEKLLSLYRAGVLPPYAERPSRARLLSAYFAEHKTGELERTIFIAVTGYRTADELEPLRPVLARLKRQAAERVL